MRLKYCRQGLSGRCLFHMKKQTCEDFLRYHRTALICLYVRHFKFAC